MKITRDGKPPVRITIPRPTERPIGMPIPVEIPKRVPQEVAR